MRLGRQRESNEADDLQAGTDRERKIRNADLVDAPDGLELERRRIFDAQAPLDETP